MREPQEILNPVSWWEVEVPDLEKAGAFYGAAFGWTMVPFGDTALFAMSGESMVCGLNQVEGEASGRGIRAYLATTDMEATLDLVDEAGGTVVTKRTPVDTGGGDMGWWALFQDPSGVNLGLWTGTPAASS